ncbi:MAG TPA: hypothetical protein VLZ31_06955 [Microbacteriaceae bacterium]|nr:hypothetical protein [Microbacteriaceae bacterium]
MQQNHENEAPVTGPAEESEAGGMSSSRKLIGGVLTSIFVIALIVVGYFVSQSQTTQKTEARVNHDVAVAEYERNWGLLQEAIAESRQILKETTNQDVRDISVLERLEEVLVEAENVGKIVPIDSANANTNQINNDTEKLKSANVKIESVLSNLLEAIEPVAGEKEAKTREVLGAEIADLLAEAEALLESTDRIKFDPIVINLIGLVEVGHQLLADDETDIDQIKKYLLSLKDSINEVKVAIEESQPKADDINGQWCPAPDVATENQECMSIELPEVVFTESEKTYEIRQAENSPILNECFNFVYGDFNAPAGSFSQVKSFGVFCPSGVEIALPSSYKGIDYPGEERIWDSQAGRMWLRQ